MKKVGQAHLFTKLIMIPVYAKKLQGAAPLASGAGRAAKRSAAMWLLTPCIAAPSRYFCLCRLPFALLNRPGIAGIQQLHQIARAHLLCRCVHLPRQQILIRRALNVAEDAD